MLPSVLIVDDEPEVLNALNRLLKKNFNVFTYTDPLEALAFFESSPTQIVISDLQMPVMDGAEFLRRSKEISPRTKRIALTGYADAELAKKAINEGHISFYLDKPWKNDTLISKMENLINELRIENKERTIVRKMKLDNARLSFGHDSMMAISNFLQGEHEHVVKSKEKLKVINYDLLQLSANLVAAQSFDTNGHSFRVAQQARCLARRFDLSELQCVYVYIAALFYRIGFSSLPYEIGAAPWHELTGHQQNLWLKHPVASAEVMRTTDVLKLSADLVLHIFEHFNGNGVPNKLKKEDIPLGSRILHVVIHYDLLVSGFISGEMISPIEASLLMEKLSGSQFDPNVLRQFNGLITKANRDEMIEIPYSVSQLQPTMTLAQDLNDIQGNKLLSENTTLTQLHIDKLLSFTETTAKQLNCYIKPQSMNNSH